MKPLYCELHKKPMLLTNKLLSACTEGLSSSLGIARKKY